MKEQIQSLARILEAFLCRFPRATRAAAAGYVLQVLAEVFTSLDELVLAEKLQKLAVELVRYSTDALDGARARQEFEELSAVERREAASSSAYLLGAFTKGRLL